MKWRWCLLMVILVAVTTVSGSASASAAEPFAAFYFHGIGCSHCKNVDSVLFSDWLKNSTALVVIEYEVYQDRENAQAMNLFNEKYGIGTGVPVLFIDQDTTLRGDRTILSEFPQLIGECEANPSYCRQNTIPFGSLDLISLPGHPRIWYRDRVLILQNHEGESDTLQRLLLGMRVSEALEGVPHTEIDPVPVRLSDQNLTYQNAVQLEGGIFQWNASELPGPNGDGHGSAGGESMARQTPLFYAPILAPLFLLTLLGLRKNHP